MAKKKLLGWMHAAVTAAFGTRSKVAVLRVLWRAASPIALREVVRRSGQAYGSIDLAIRELTAIGLVEVVPGSGHERRVRFQAGHRLANSIAALLQAEADFFPALRVELRATATRAEGIGLLSAAIVGATSRHEETIGGSVEVVIIARDPTSVQPCREQFESLGDRVASRFGATLHVIVYDRETARSMWRSHTAAAARDVADAELLAGQPLASMLDG